MKRPYEHLPMPMPADFDPGVDFFYSTFVKAFIPDMLQMMDTGLPVDPEAVEDLRKVIDEVQATVYERLENSSLIQNYRESRLPKAQKEHAEKATQSVRTSKHYIKIYKPSDILHRTWVVNTYLKYLHLEKDCRDKWIARDLKQYNIFLKDPFITAIVEKRPLSSNKHAIEGMQALAVYKAELWNRPRYDKAKETVTVLAFNPNSNKQVKEFFELMKIDPLAVSKDTGEASWGREQLETVQVATTDPELLTVLDALIDNSFSAIIKNNFIKAFDTYTIDGVLHGNIKIFGAKSFRNTSNSPNLLNAPSTRSLYAKPLKRCFVAPKGSIIYTADLSALEDRVIANLSGDVNKQNIFLKGIDGHSLNACGYFKEQVETQIGKYPEDLKLVRAFMHSVDEGNQVLKKLRQDSKAPTFKLAYGGFPDSDRGGVITQDLFDNYHNVLYPGITDYRENYVLPTAKAQGYIHLGLGCRLYTSDSGQDIRTLNNATVQFWSIITLIAVNELNHRIREAQLTKEIQLTSTIYDSIYAQVHNNLEIIQWLNNNMIEVLTTPYIEDETIGNAAHGEIGLNWADLHKIPNNASLSQINEVLKLL